MCHFCWLLDRLFPRDGGTKCERHHLGCTDDEENWWQENLQSVQRAHLAVDLSFVMTRQVPNEDGALVDSNHKCWTRRIFDHRCVNDFGGVIQLQCHFLTSRAHEQAPWPFRFLNQKTRRNCLQVPHGAGKVISYVTGEGGVQFRLVDIQHLTSLCIHADRPDFLSFLEHPFVSHDAIHETAHLAIFADSPSSHVRALIGLRRHHN
mmetsp:Transcript_62164/g.110476  ORF Transcript_62164/g.110476 Transcript_62164/m.110476 type:complete len:206 (-) Transcript_62164:1235-1852(-)